MQNDPENASPGSNLSDEDAAEMMRQAIEAAETPDSGKTATASESWEPPLPEDLAPLMPGYTIKTLVGRGGMGAVYRGVQDSLDREVAIKLLPPELGQNPEFEARFQREAKSMAKLNHPNIVQIFDYGQTSAGHHYIVMEFVDGTDLHQLIRSQELTSEGALNAISQICDALEYAHSEGFVHRDIKPANMFINSKGTLKVGDFGLAKLVENETSQSLREQMGLTMTGVAMGTPHYIAPEQLDESASVDQRADIYSLGIMFYEMLTGEIPRGAVKSPSEKKKTIDVRIDGVVFKAMESDPGERYQSATDLRSDVDVIRTSIPSPQSGESEAPAQNSSAPSPTQRRSGNPFKLIAGIGIPVLIAGAILFALFGNSEPPSEDNADTGPAEGEASENSTPPLEFPAYKQKPGLLRGLVYDQQSKRVVPLPVPSGWKMQKFSGIGASRGKSETSAQTAFTSWAINEEGLLGYWSNGNPRMGLPALNGKLKHFDEIIGISLEGRLVVKSDSRFYPAPPGNNFVDIETGNTFAVALTSAGEARLWTSNDYNGPFLEPPASILKNVKAVSANHTNATLLSADGKVTVWNIAKGPVANKLNGHKSVIAINNSLSLNADGTLNSLGYKHLQFDEKITAFHNGGELLSLRLASGQWKIFQRSGSESEAAAAIIEAFNEKQQHPIIDLVVEAPGGYGSAIAIWTEEAPGDSSGKPPELRFPPVDPAGKASALIKSASRETPYQNALEMSFVPVPISGGPTDGEIILFSTQETRVADFTRFITDNPGIDWRKPDFDQADDHPAVKVQWESAVAFCNWLTELDRRKGRLSEDEIYRLPSDHEWSCAAGIGHLEIPEGTPESKECRIPKLFPWGDQLPPPEDFANYYGNETVKNPVPLSHGRGFKNPLRGYQDSFEKTSPAGSFAANPYGLFDLSGNASEWCSDWFTPQKEKRTLRGASWGISLGHVLLSSSRIAMSPTIRFDTNGFRCVIATVKNGQEATTSGQ